MVGSVVEAMGEGILTVRGENLPQRHGGTEKIAALLKG
jgi:hypothetical protein